MKKILFLVMLLLAVPIISSQSFQTVTVTFEIKDSSNLPIENALIIIQGISNQDYNKNILTDSNGKASISLNQNEIFVYTIYKLGYVPASSNIFTNSNKAVQVNLLNVAKDHWNFYYENNGEIEVIFKSLDSDTNYLSGEYVNEVLEVKNVAGVDIHLVNEETSLLTVDAETLKRLRWWGGLRSQDLLKGVLVDITLKKDGWMKAKVENGYFEICVGNAIGEYKGQRFDVSGSEFICETDDGKNKIPEWILETKYKFHFNVTYLINGEKKVFSLLTQDFFIENPLMWKPELVLYSDTIPNQVNKEIIYQIPMKYPEHFVYYSLLEPPSGMKIDKIKGIINWLPKESGKYDIKVRAYFPYFENDPRMAYTDGEFVLRVMDEYCEIYNRKKVPEKINENELKIQIYCR